MREPPLSCGVQLESYRILWIQSFSESPPNAISKWPPTMVRISKSNAAWVVTGVQLAGSVNRKEIERRERTLIEAESLEMLVGGRRIWTVGSTRLCP